MRNKITPQHSIEILKKMAQAVGQDYDELGEGFFEKQHWYWDFSWTVEQQNEFRDWLAEFLLKNKYASTRLYRDLPQNIYEANKMVANYGWKVK